MSSVVQIGNFGPSHSTENHLLQALVGLDHDVTPVQENDVEAWRDTDSSPLWRSRPDVVLWTRTGWDWDSLGIAPAEMHVLQHRFLERCENAGIPTVGYHLDRWWGLAREHEVATEPFFSCSLVCTADGGHDKEWADAGVNHAWFPPAVSLYECEPAQPEEAYASDIAFVGSWQGYHPEWEHRAQLVAWLSETWGDRVRFWPQPGQPAVRGHALRQLYASVKVCVGDSCLVPAADGTPVERYWSDRVPETLGRGGILVHPWVEGLPFLPGVHLWAWHLGDFDALHEVVGLALGQSDDGRARMREDARRIVRRHHTYSARMRTLWQRLELA